MDSFVDSLDDVGEWQQMLEAMSNLGIGPTEQKQIFDVIAEPCALRNRTNCAHMRKGQCGDAACAGRVGRGGLQRTCRVDPAARASDRAEEVRVAP